MIKKLLVNSSIKIETISSKQSYKSRVEEIKSEGIWIAAPMSKGIVVPIAIKESLNMSYFDDSCIYSFTTEVLKRVSTPLPMLLVKTPEEKNITKIQRRYFVRVNAIMPIEYGKVPLDQRNLRDMKMEKANTIDLSGGGLQFLTKETIEDGQLLQLNLSLKNETLIIFGKAVRIRPYPNKEDREYWAIGVEFVNISEGERDKIIKYVFDWQREMRKKGIL